MTFTSYSERHLHSVRSVSALVMPDRALFIYFLTFTLSVYVSNDNDNNQSREINTHSQRLLFVALK